MAGSSCQNSGITYDDLTRFADQEATSSPDVIGRDMSIQWTDEKHSLYITSMEASFVEQLQSSKDSFRCRIQTIHGSDVKSRASGQVKNLSKPEASARDKHYRSSNYYMHQYSHAGEHSYFATNCKEEVSDQNFVQGDFQTDRASER